MAKVRDTASPPSAPRGALLNQTLPRGLLDFMRGGATGAATGLLGGPVDLATAVMRPLGYSVEKPVGGSEWWRDQGQAAGVYGDRTGTPEESAGEFVGAVVAPGPDPMQYAAAGMGMAGMARKLNLGDLDPNSLLFREENQNRTSEIATRFKEKKLPPIVSVQTDDGVSVIDGHNRAAYALEKGLPLQGVTLSAADYAALKEAEFDDMEISYAALKLAGAKVAAENIDRQFPGAKVREYGEKAAKVLRAR